MHRTLGAIVIIVLGALFASYCLYLYFSFESFVDSTKEVKAKVFLTDPPRNQSALTEKYWGGEDGRIYDSNETIPVSDYFCRFRPGMTYAVRKECSSGLFGESCSPVFQTCDKTALFKLDDGRQVVVNYGKFEFNQIVSKGEGDAEFVEIEDYSQGGLLDLKYDLKNPLIFFDPQNPESVKLYGGVFTSGLTAAFILLFGLLSLFGTPGVSIFAEIIGENLDRILRGN